MQSLDAYYFPNLRYVIYKIAKRLLETGSHVDVNALIDQMISECPTLGFPAAKLALIRRTRKAIKSLVITGDICIDTVLNDFKREKIVITSVNS